MGSETPSPDAISGSNPMATNSVVPIPKPPRARASIAGPLAERTPGVEVSERERVDEVTDQLWSHTWLNFQVRAGEFTHVRPRTQMGRPVSRTSHQKVKQ